VINQPGASGVIGTQAIINSAADAYTIGSINPLFTGVLASRPDASFSRDAVSGVTMFARQNFIIFANKNVPFDNVKQMIAYSKSNPDKLVYASPGIGSYVHLTMEHLSSVQSLSMIHAPYRGIMQAAPDVVGGRVQLLITINNSGLEGLVVKGDLKVIGSLGENATYLGTVVQSLPDVVPGISAYSYYALIVPRGVSQSKIDRIQMDVSNIVARPEFRKQMLDMGLIPYNMPSKEFDRWIDHEVARLKQIIKKSQIKIE
jgi:tripartite-type tricarboxylate transporter receptor subunit TctC